MISSFASTCLMAAMLMFSSGPAAAQFFPAFGLNAANATSWVAGAHAGYNWQQGSMIYGFETDFQATHLNSSMTGELGSKTSAMIDYYGTFRGRIGFTTGQWLFFATGGGAYGNVDLSSRLTALEATTASETLQPRIGWVVGAGLEYLLRPNWMLTFNYQYTDLGRVSLSSSALVPDANFMIGQAASVHAQFQTVTIGFSYRFAPDGSPSPWAGGYAGGQAGGARGENADALYTILR